jgi:HEAT repeat protein
MKQDFESLLSGLRAPELSDAVLYRLSNLHGAQLQKLGAAWSSLPTENRQRIALRLDEIAEADFETDFGEVFKICMADLDPQVRRVGVDGLWEDQDVALIRPLVDLLLHDEAEMVREAAATSLSRFALLAELGHLTPRLTDMVWQALWDTYHNAREDVNVRRRVIESIAYFDRPEVAAMIEAAYQHDEDIMRISAVFAMGRSADERWSELVIDELDRDDPQMRYEAARACGELRVSEAVPMLSKMVIDPDLEVKLAAVWALGQIGGQEAQRVLEICLEQGDEALQDAAEEALAEMDLMEGVVDLSLYDYAEDQDDEEVDWEEPELEAPTEDIYLEESDADEDDDDEDEYSEDEEYDE